MSIQTPHSRTVAPRLQLVAADVKEAGERIAGHVRPLTVIQAGPIPADGAVRADGDPTADAYGGADFSGGAADDSAHLFLACESTQATGSFKARGALNYARYHLQYGVMPNAGVAIAATGSANAAVACAWAARQTSTKATVFAAEHCAPAALARMRSLHADVRRVDGDAAAAEHAAAVHARECGALYCQPQDNILTAAGAGTVARDIIAALGDDIDTIVLPVVGGTLLAGTIAALERTGIRIVPVEPAGRPTLSAALAAGHPVQLPADPRNPASLGAAGLSGGALALAEAAGVEPVTVPDAQISAARRALWERHRLAVEHCAATGLAALACGAYVPDPFERVVVVLTGGNGDLTDLADLAQPQSPPAGSARSAR